MMTLLVCKGRSEATLGLLFSCLLALITYHSCLKDRPSVQELLGLQNYDSYKGFFPDSVLNWRRKLLEEAYETTPSAPQYFVRDHDLCRWFFIMNRHPTTFQLHLKESIEGHYLEKTTKLMHKDDVWALRVDCPVQLYFALPRQVKRTKAMFQFSHRVFSRIWMYEKRYKKKLRLVKWLIDSYDNERGDGVIVAAYIEERDEKLEMAYVLHIGWDTLLRAYAPPENNGNYWTVPLSLFKVYIYEDEGCGRVLKEFTVKPRSRRTYPQQNMYMLHSKHGRKDKRNLERGPLRPAKKMKLEKTKDVEKEVASQLSDISSKEKANVGSPIDGDREEFREEAALKSVNPPKKETMVHDKREIMEGGAGLEEEEDEQKQVTSHVVSQLANPSSAKEDANVRSRGCEDGERDASECEEFDDFFSTYMKLPS